MFWSGAMRWRMFITGLVGRFSLFIFHAIPGFHFLSISGLICLVCCCRRPTSLHDRGRDSDDDDFRDRDYDVAALANNLSQAFRYGIYSNDDIEEVC
jgi:hypothetical protein